MAQFSIVKKSELEGATRLDAEYYMPKYLQLVELLDKSNAQPLGNFISDIRYGMYTEPDYLDEGVNFIRGLNLGEHTIQGEILKVRQGAVPNKGYLLEKDDMLIARSGSVGTVGLITDRFVGATFGSYTIRIRFKDINPAWACAFFKTRFGKLQVERLSTQVAQPNVNVPNLKTLRIVCPSIEHQKQVETLGRECDNNVLNSESLYLQAEQLLLDGLGFEELDLSHQLYYTVPYEKAREAGRLDAEYFRPKYDRLIQHLVKTGKSTKLQGILDEPVLKGITPEYDPDGDIVVVNSQHLGRYYLDIDSTDRTTQAFWQRNMKAQVKPMDVMVYATGAYIGRTNIWPVDYKAVAGVDILLVRPSEACNPYYLSVYLNSPLGILQAEKFARGSGQRHIYPADIACFVVYLPTMDFQQRIADLVTQSWEARQKARQLLEEAKHIVENIVESKTG